MAASTHVDVPALRRYLDDKIRARKAITRMTYKDLSEALAVLNIQQSPSNLSTKVDRGGYSAQFFVALMYALGEEKLDLRELAEYIEKYGLTAE